MFPPKFGMNDKILGKKCSIVLCSFNILPETFLCLFTAVHEFQSVARTFEFGELFCSTVSYLCQRDPIK